MQRILGGRIPRARMITAGAVGDHWQDLLVVRPLEDTPRLRSQAIDLGQRLPVPSYQLERFVLSREEDPTLQRFVMGHVEQEVHERGSLHWPRPPVAPRHVAREPARSRQVVDHADGYAAPSEAARHAQRLEVASEE